MEVRRAIIPAAGKGSRVQAVRTGIPKEMIPVGGRPMIAHCIEEALLAGLQEICIILGPEKGCVREYLDAHPAAESTDPRLEGRQSWRFVFLVQREPTGLANALSLARGFVGRSPFAYILPDEIFIGNIPAIQQVAEAAASRCEHALGLQRLDGDKAFGHVWCGAVDVVPLEERLYRITKLYPKEDKKLLLNSGEGIWKGFPRGIVFPSFFDYLDALHPGDGIEYDDGPIWEAMIAQEGLLGVWLDGKGFDLGNPDGLRAGISFFAEEGVGSLSARPQI